jgi:transcription antitermination factor NusG
VKLEVGMQVKVITSPDRLFKGRIVEIHDDGWLVMIQELGDRVQINSAHIVAIEE